MQRTKMTLHYEDKHTEEIYIKDLIIFSLGDNSVFDENKTIWILNKVVKIKYRRVACVDNCSCNIIGDGITFSSCSELK